MSRSVRLVALALAWVGASACSSGERPTDVAQDEASDVPRAGADEAQGQSVTPRPGPPLPAAPEDACERATACCGALLAAAGEGERAAIAEDCATLELVQALEGQARLEACFGALRGFQSTSSHGGGASVAACR